MEHISGAAVRGRLFASYRALLSNRLKSAVAALAVTSLMAGPVAAQTYWSGNGPIILSEGPGCQNISNLTVSLHVTQDMWAVRTGQDVQGQQANGGFSFQLNASPKQYGGQPPVYWLQYLIVLRNNRAFAFFQYFDHAGTYAQPNPGQNSTIMASNALPAGNMIPAGYVLTIALTNDAAGNVTGATLSITDNAGKISSFSIPSAREALPNYGRSPNNNYILSPFASVAAPVLGPLNWDTSTFMSGAGYITYSIPNGQLVHEQPKTCGFQSTGEKSNASYGMINPSAGSTIVQPMTTPFAGALASNMDAADNTVQVYHFMQYPPNGKNNNNGNFYLNQFAFNGAWSAQDVTATAAIPAATLGSPVIAYQNTLSKAPEAYYFATTAQGGQQVEQLEGKAWTATSLSTVTSAMPPALGSGLAGYVDPITGSDNVVYQGVDQHLHLLTKPAGANWKEEPGPPNTPAVAFAGAITAHMTAGSEEIFYIGADQHIYEVWRWSNNFDGWHTADLTQAGSTSPVAIGSPLAGFYDPTQKAFGDLVFFEGTDRHIHEYAFGNGQWTSTDLTLKANAQPVGYGSALAAHLNRATDSQEIFFVNADQTLEKISSSNGGRPVWTSTNLSNLVGGTQTLATPGSPLAANTNSISKTDELYYVGMDGAVHEMSSPNNGQWSSSTP